MKKLHFANGFVLVYYRFCYWALVLLSQRKIQNRVDDLRWLDAMGLRCTKRHHQKMGG